MAIIIIIVLTYIYTSLKQQQVTFVTMHARCNSDSPCDGELVCDKQSKRCKKPLNGICATDVDCETDIFCVGWKCSKLDIKSKNSKQVKWNESKNSVRLF